MIGVNSSIPFGKYKGKTFADVMLSDPGYCAWLRQAKIKDGDLNPFTTEANLVIDDAIRQSKSLSKKYAIVKPTEEDLQLQNILKEAHDKKSANDAVIYEERKSVAYADQWGSW